MKKVKSSFFRKKTSKFLSSLPFKTQTIDNQWQYDDASGKMCYAVGFTKDMVSSLLTKKEAIRCNGKIYSEEHKRKFEIMNDIFMVEKNPTDRRRVQKTMEKLREGLRKTEEPRKKK